jgi:hypothetical protein
VRRQAARPPGALHADRTDISFLHGPALCQDQHAHMSRSVEIQQGPSYLLPPQRRREQVSPCGSRVVTYLTSTRGIQLAAIRCSV